MSDGRVLALLMAAIVVFGWLILGVMLSSRPLPIQKMVWAVFLVIVVVDGLFLALMAGAIVVARFIR